MHIRFHDSDKSYMFFPVVLYLGFSLCGYGYSLVVIFSVLGLHFTRICHSPFYYLAQCHQVTGKYTSMFIKAKRSTGLCLLVSALRL